MHRSQEWVRPGGCNGGDKEERREVRARRNKTVFSVSTIPSVQRTLGWLAEKCNRFSSHSISTTVNALAPWRRSGDILLANDRWFYSPEREPRSMRWIIYIVSRVSRDCIYIIEGIPGAPLSWIKSSTDLLDSHGDLRDERRRTSEFEIRWILSVLVRRLGSSPFDLVDFGVGDSQRRHPGAALGGLILANDWWFYSSEREPRSMRSLIRIHYRWHFRGSPQLNKIFDRPPRFVRGFPRAKSV